MNATHKLMLNALIIAATASPAIFRAESAEAEVRINARIVTPNVRVEVGNGPVRHLPQPVVVYEHRGWNDGCDRSSCDLHEHWGARVSRYDRQVATRLARMSGVSRFQLLRARARGASWDRIGRDFRLPRPMVRAAMDPVAYARWCEHTPGFGRDHDHDRGRGHDRDRGRRHGR